MQHQTHRITKLLLIAALSFAASGTQLLAQTTYSYMGEPFMTADPPYTTSDRVTGSFTVPLPLPPSLNMVEISGSLLDFAFADGVQSRTPGNTTICTFEVSTDSLGSLVDWRISLRQAPTPSPGNPQQFLDSNNFGDQVGEGPAGTIPCDTLSATIIASTLAIGDWVSDQVPGSALTYDYLGDPFTAATAPYTTSDRVTGSIDLASPLPPFLPLTEIGPLLLDFTFQDGVQTRIPSNTFPCTFQVATNGSGNIIDWRIFLREIPLPAPSNPQQLLDSSAFSGDSVGEGPAGTGICDDLMNVTGAENSTPGTWSSPLPPGTPTAYDYIGTPFVTADAPWTVGDNVTGSMLLSDTLPPDLPLTDVSLVLLDFSFQDGVQVRTPGNTAICDLRVGTDGNGDIVDWRVSLHQGPTPAPGQPQRFLDSSTTEDQAGEGPAGLFDCDTISLAAVATSAASGTWTRRGTAIIPTLSPAALVLLALALAIAAGWVSRRRSAARS